MKFLAAIACLALTQTEGEEAAVPAQSSVVPETEAAPENTATTPAPAVNPGPRPPGLDEVTKTLQKLPKLTEKERREALDELEQRFRNTETNPVLPPGQLNLSSYLQMEPQEQALVTARAFFSELLDGNTSGVIRHCGYPFFLESRRVDKLEELREHWGKQLRSRRVDLLTLYGVEVLTAAEMEKKYGKPPARLSPWNWRQPNSLLAIANLSGHAAVILLRPVGAAWQVVGFHD